jgi:surface protein
MALSLTFDITDTYVTIDLPISGSYTSFDLQIDWGDNTYNNTTSHQYTNTGTYTVIINNWNSSITTFGSANTNWGQQYLISCNSFGNVGITNLNYAFYYADNLQSVPSVLPSNVTNLSNMFNSASNFNQDISNWDVSKVTDMSYMFAGAKAFDQNIGGWDVSNVLDMKFMFVNAQNFDQNISDWNVSKVTNMSFMFAATNNFNQPIGSWDVSSVTTMLAMFQYATSFQCLQLKKL